MVSAGMNPHTALTEFSDWLLKTHNNGAFNTNLGHENVNREVPSEGITQPASDVVHEEEEEGDDNDGEFEVEDVVHAEEEESEDSDGDPGVKKLGEVQVANEDLLEASSKDTAEHLASTISRSFNNVMDDGEHTPALGADVGKKRKRHTEEPSTLATPIVTVNTSNFPVVHI